MVVLLNDCTPSSECKVIDNGFVDETQSAPSDSLGHSPAVDHKQSTDIWSVWLLVLLLTIRFCTNSDSLEDSPAVGHTSKQSTAGITMLRTSSDGLYMAAADADCHVLLWQKSTLPVRHMFTESSANLNMLTISTSGAIDAACRVKLWQKSTLPVRLHDRNIINLLTDLDITCCWWCWL